MEKNSQLIRLDEKIEDQAGPQTTINADDLLLVLDFISEAAEHIDSAENSLLELETKPDDKELVNCIFRAFHTIKGLAAFLNLTEIGSLAHAAENLLDQIRKDRMSLDSENSDMLLESIDMTKKMIACLADAAEKNKPVPTQKRLPQLLAKLNDLVENQALAASLASPESEKKDNQLDQLLQTQNTNTSQQTNRTAREEKIKVRTERLENLVNITGELVIAQSMVAENVNKMLPPEHIVTGKVNQQGKIIRQLQQLSMSMRMVPIQPVFQKMARVIRDLSKKAKKNVNFVTAGEETELDRTIVDKIVDPLIHMVRNAVDHAIETPAEREKLGKNPVGKIEMRAFQQAGKIVITVQDDGAGLNKKRIIQKAIESGIVTSDENLTERQIYKLIFKPGFSTAQKVTSVSGRGVGMDVVKENVEAIQGRIGVTSIPEKGTTFTIKLPLTLAIVDGQVVKVGSERYIIPVTSIKQSFRPSEQQLSTVYNRGEMVNVRGELVPIIRLYELFGLVPKSKDPTKSLLVMVEEAAKKYCLLVDQLLGQKQVVIKNLGKNLGKLKAVSGGSIMGDGKVSLVLDVPGLIALAGKQK